MVLSDDQIGFRSGRGSWEAILLALRLIIEKKIEVGKELCITFKNTEKTFDRVTRAVLFAKL